MTLKQYHQKTALNAAGASNCVNLKQFCLGVGLVLSSLFLLPKAGAQELTLLSEPSTLAMPIEVDSPKVLQWKNLISDKLSDAGLPANKKLATVNQFWNDLKQVNDSVLFGMEDVWSTPEETLRLGAGDCEDLAIGKYFTLLEVGFEESRLTLAHVNMARYGGHMVLIYSDDDQNQWVLDNMNRQISLLEKRSDLQLVYTLNRMELRFANMKHVKANPSTIAHWKGVMERLGQSMKVAGGSAGA